MKDLKLCFVKYGWAYFSSIPAAEQSGDDWDNTPYEHNAGEPNVLKKGKKDVKIMKVSFEAPEHSEPSCGDVSLSAAEINKGKSPWLKVAEWAVSSKQDIFSDTTLDDFIKIIKSSGGEVYLPA